jgi:hypothetical protein
LVAFQLWVIMGKPMPLRGRFLFGGFPLALGVGVRIEHCSQITYTFALKQESDTPLHVREWLWQLPPRASLELRFR